MSPLCEEYRKQAQYCMKMSEQATAELKISWLKLAARWLEMLPTKEPEARDQYEDTRSIEPPGPVQQKNWQTAC